MIIHRAGVCVVSMLFAAPAFAEDVESAIQRSFVKPWAAAVQSGDATRIARFIHPSVLACRSEQTREYFDFVISNDASHKFTGTYVVTKVGPMEGSPPAFLPAEAFPYPVQPTYEVQIQFGDTTLIRYLAPAGGSWFEVYPCPNEKGMAFMKAQIANGTEQRRHASQLAAEAPAPLREEIKVLLSQGRKIDAIKKYREATGADLTTAHLVIEVIAAATN